MQTARTATREAQHFQSTPACQLSLSRFKVSSGGTDTQGYSTAARLPAAAPNVSLYTRFVNLLLTSKQSAAPACQLLVAAVTKSNCC